MLIKLAFRNVRRSVRDYVLYFATLLFGVAIFYAFNSISSQSILFDLQSSSSQDIFESTNTLLSMFSGVVACVLGFLVIYANRFLIKRRKLEFGTYLLLGMKSYQVSTIVLLETVLVGIVSLVLGLISGIALSQGLSFFTALMLTVPMAAINLYFPAMLLFQRFCVLLLFLL